MCVCVCANFSRGTKTLLDIVLAIFFDYLSGNFKVLVFLDKMKIPRTTRYPRQINSDIVEEFCFTYTSDNFLWAFSFSFLRVVQRNTTFLFDFPFWYQRTPNNRWIVNRAFSFSGTSLNSQLIIYRRLQNEWICGKVKLLTSSYTGWARNHFLLK